MRAEYRGAAVRVLSRRIDEGSSSGDVMRPQAPES